MRGHGGKSRGMGADLEDRHMLMIMCLLAGVVKAPSGNDEFDALALETGRVLARLLRPMVPGELWAEWRTIFRFDEPSARRAR